MMLGKLAGVFLFESFQVVGPKPGYGPMVDETVVDSNIRIIFT